VSWGDDAGFPEVRCIIDESNVASVRVAEKVGFSAVGEARLGDDTVTVYGRQPNAMRYS
jgi:RimJ/RimL family protein N-acetyltransferase